MWKYMDNPATLPPYNIILHIPNSNLNSSPLLLPHFCLMTTDHLQFGYKRGHSTSHAIYVMRTCIDYFTQHGSNVFAAFLDCTKVFDKVDHSGIFLKRIDRLIPLCFLNVNIPISKKNFPPSSS